MADMNITQAEADALIAMPKIRASDDMWNYPSLGGAISIPLVSPDKRENFLLDIRKGRIDLSKGSYQNRSRQVIVLVRIDFGGSVHRNPDGAEVQCPHLHLYREGYGDKWAMPLPADLFPDAAEVMNLLDAFMRYCNIVEPPIIQRGLFS
jgi:hypothetical protein